MKVPKRRIIKIIGFIAVFLALNALAAFLVTPAEYYIWPIVKDRIVNQGKIDTIFIGASRAYRAFRPSVFDKELQCVSFNAGSQAQTIWGSDYYIKDFVSTNPIKTVVFECSYTRFDKSDQTSFLADELLYERLINPWLKARFFFEKFNTDEYLGALSKAHLFKDNYKFDIIKTVLRKKRIAFSGIDPETMETNKTIYDGKGFLFNGFKKSNGTFGVFRPAVWDSTEENKAFISYRYLKQMIEYCKDRDIDFILVSAPVPNAYLQMVGEDEYNDIHGFFADIAKEYDIPYYDFNLAKFKVSDLKDENFMDKHHLNGYGSTKFSALCAQIMRDAKDGADISKYFYDSFADLENDIDFVCAASIFAEKNASNTVDMRAEAAMPSHVKAEYRFLAKAKGEQGFTVIRDYSPETSFNWTPGESKAYTLRVEARAINSNGDREAAGEIKLK